MNAWDTHGLSYVSAHSADVILSDIRPVKLRAEALKSINLLLDEFLYTVIKSASSLTTDRLRAGLLSILPTSVGKEALLEAEVELRAYWDRTKSTRPSPADDDRSDFHLQWAFELLRLKCSAWSTLNESDEDPAAEASLQDNFAPSGAQAPKPTIVAPAALYLTAIIEAVCEHILSNVGRVAARDSSRTYATIQDLFTALCEDDAIYGLFKTMKVYDQIEEMSKPPKLTRNKSLSRSDGSLPRTSSPHQDQLTTKDSPTPPPVLTRLSTEASLTVAPSISSRSSLDKKGMKKFIPSGRSSHDSDNRDGHKRSDSVLSDNTKRTWAAAYSHGTQGSVDDVSLKDFDDLMRSGSTMKVSLTPDRLRTMEVHKHEKDRRGTNQPPSLSTSQQEDEPSSAPLPRPPNARRPSAARQVDSITEDDEEHSRNSSIVQRTTSSSAPTSSLSTAPSAASRLRSLSTSSAKSHQPRKSSKSSSITSPPVSYTASNSDRDMSRGGPKGVEPSPFPQKTRKVQRNRESLDLDDVMAGSDDDQGIDEPPVTPAKPVVSSPPPRRAPKVSARTKELMEFLNDGPPDDSPALPRSMDLSQSMSDLPPIENGKKGSGRLQRMMSKLSLGGERARQLDDLRTGTPVRTPTVTKSPSYSSLPNKTSTSNISVLANRPIPPRPPFVSPPSSPVNDEPSPPSNRPRNASVSRRNLPNAWENRGAELPIPPSPRQLPPEPIKEDKLENGYGNRSLDHSSTTRGHGNRNGQLHESIVKQSKATPPSTVKSTHTQTQASTSSRPPTAQSPARITPAEPEPATKPNASLVDAGAELRRLLSKATSADECRLLLDAFLGRVGAPGNGSDYDVPYPSPSPSDHNDAKPAESDPFLEHAVVELLLGGDSSTPVSLPPQKKSYVTRKKVPDVKPPSPTNDRATPSDTKRRITPPSTSIEVRA